MKERMRQQNNMWRRRPSTPRRYQARPFRASSRQRRRQQRPCRRRRGRSARLWRNPRSSARCGGTLTRALTPAATARPRPRSPRLPRPRRLLLPLLLQLLLLLPLRRLLPLQLLRRPLPLPLRAAPTATQQQRTRPLLPPPPVLQLRRRTLTWSRWLMRRRWRAWAGSGSSTRCWCGGSSAAARCSSGRSGCGACGGSPRTSGPPTSSRPRPPPRCDAALRWGGVLGRAASQQGALPSARVQLVQSTKSVG
mmetsp:Transcript_16766/g.40134  ORF Transcript_16766/g.40134 Transcript_16766/m.40134 type:complete len:251 (+) Transcript_16766:497-1249(+)